MSLLTVKRIVLCLVGVLISSCALMPNSTPLWYDHTDIVMRDYIGKKVIMLPLIAEDGQGLDARSEKQVIDSVRLQFKHVFTIKPRYLSEAMLAKEGFVRPYNPSKIAKHFDAAAFLVSSVFDVESSLTRKGELEYRKVGLKLSFFDSQDPYSYWRISKRYQSEGGFDVKNIDFDYVLFADLRKVKRVVVSSHSEKNSRKLEKKTSPSVVVAVKDTKVTPDASQKDRFQTHANVFDLELSVLDAYGLSHVLVFDGDNNVVAEADFSYQTVLAYNKSFIVPLRLGKNRIRIDVANVEQKETSRFINVERRKNAATHVIAVSSPYQQSKENYKDIQGWLDNLNSPALRSDRYRNLVYLDQSKLPRIELMSAIELLAIEADVNEFLQPVLFFSGRVERRTHRRLGEKYYLMLSDSDERLLRSTALDLDDVLDVLGEQAFVMLEFCDDSAPIMGDYRLPQRPVKVHVYSCNRSRGEMSSRFVRSVEKSRSLAEIISAERAVWQALPPLPAINEAQARPRKSLYY